VVMGLDACVPVVIARQLVRPESPRSTDCCTTTHLYRSNRRDPHARSRKFSPGRQHCAPAPRSRAAALAASRAAFSTSLLCSASSRLALPPSSNHTQSRTPPRPQRLLRLSQPLRWACCLTVGFDVAHLDHDARARRPRHLAQRPSETLTTLALARMWAPQSCFSMSLGDRGLSSVRAKPAGRVVDPRDRVTHAPRFAHGWALLGVGPLAHSEHADAEALLQPRRT
jgi:hypothetical protein